MKILLLIVSFLFLTMAALATPIAIGFGLYDWVGNGVEFKFALWFGFKLWISMLISGFAVGIPCFFAAK